MRTPIFLSRCEARSFGALASSLSTASKVRIEGLVEIIFLKLLVRKSSNVVIFVLYEWNDTEFQFSIQLQILEVHVDTSLFENHFCKKIIIL